MTDEEVVEAAQKIVAKLVNDRHLPPASVISTLGRKDICLFSCRWCGGPVICFPLPPPEERTHLGVGEIVLAHCALCDWAYRF